MASALHRYAFLALLLACVHPAEAATLSLFSDAGDLANFLVSNSTDADSVVADGASSPASALDGDAVRIFDSNSSGRTTLRWRPSTANTDGLRMSFDYVVDPSATGRVLFRGGNDAASLASITRAGVALEINADGSVGYSYDDGGSRVGATSAAAGAGTRVAVSLVVNTATAGDLMYEALGTAVTLGPQKFDLYLNGSAVATGLDILNSGSNFDGALGLQDFWFLSGGNSAEVGVEHQIDNWAIHTGDNISFVPEPSALLIALSLVTGVARPRNRRQ